MSERVALGWASVRECHQNVLTLTRRAADTRAMSPWASRIVVALVLLGLVAAIVVIKFVEFVSGQN